MSELDRHLSAWRASIASAGALTRDDVDELERHVRDSVAELTGRGLSEEEAVLVALRRIGDPALLAVEYRKVNPGLAWARRWYWMTAGFLGFSLALEATRVLGHVGAWLTIGTGAPDVGFLAVGLGGVFALCYGMVRSAKVPGGGVARVLQSLAGWVHRRPIAAANAGFTVLASMTILDRFARAYLWRTIGLEGVLAIGTFDAVAVIAAPIGLFALAVWINRGNDRLVLSRG